MNNSSGRTPVSRRKLLHTVGAGTVAVGFGLGAFPGTAAAMNKAELIEQMASEAGLANAEAFLDGVTTATTNALRAGNSVVLDGFGAFSISKRSARTGRNPRSSRGAPAESPVTFEPCPAFAAALDLNPGRGDEASARCRDADVILDAAAIASESGRDSKHLLSKADAKRALEAFVHVTTKALKTGDRLSLGEGFGELSISKRSARTGRNPQTGKEIQIAAKNVVKFKAGAELSKAVN